MAAALPPPVEEGVADALARLGLPRRILRATPVTGGCINHGARVDASGGRAFFLKWNASAPPRLFDAEAEGLRALRAAGPLRVPEPLARGGGSGSPSWLLMEWIEPGMPAPDYDVRLGRGLALTHRGCSAPLRFGWSRPNWIGSLPQANRRVESWAAFWRDLRILPQLKRALDRGHFGGEAGRTLDRLVAAIPTALADVDRGPIHLLHGDLWGGNAYPAANGAPVLVDPAVYCGHGEVDLAMTELFGGFGPGFYDAYREAGTVTEAYASYRRELYQLYYLLVHVNLFGSSYERRAIAAAARVLAEVGA